MKFYQVNLVWKQAREKILLQPLKKTNPLPCSISFLLEVNDPSADINNLADNLTNIILNAANKTFHFKQFKRNKKRKRYKQKWFNGSPFDQPKTELKN